MPLKAGRLPASADEESSNAKRVHPAQCANYVRLIDWGAAALQLIAERVEFSDILVVLPACEVVDDGVYCRVLNIGCSQLGNVGS